MLIFTSAYVLLALASWSALAVPLGSERNNERAELSSSTLTSRQLRLPGDMGPGPAVTGLQPRPQTGTDPIVTGDSSPMDCGGNSDSKSTSTDNGGSNNTDDGNSNSTDVGTIGEISPLSKTRIGISSPTTTSTGPPVIARRRFRSSMRRRNSNKVSRSIFERDSPNASTTDKPITLGDLLDHYLSKRAASRKRAMSPRTSRGAK